MMTYKGVNLSTEAQRRTRIEFFKSNKSFLNKDIRKSKLHNSKVFISIGGSIEIHVYKNGFTYAIKKKKGVFSTTYEPFHTITRHLKNDDNYVISNKDYELFENLKKVKSLYTKIRKTIIKEIKESEKNEKLKEEQRLKELEVSQTKLIGELDKDGNGEVDVVEGNDFYTLLKKHQTKIVEIDRSFVQKFVRVSSYLKTKKENIQFIFNSIKNTPNQKTLNEYVEILKDDIHSYNLIYFNSLNMIVSLVEDDMITFYEIYEMFDDLNMFDSKHERDVSQRLTDIGTNIGNGLKSLMYEIRDMGNHICDSIGELTYVTEESNQQLTERLKEIDSSVQTNNLLTVIQTYQMYKINKNTKPLIGRKN